MKIAVMQPYLFPYIGYFQLINIADKFIIFDDVNYIKKGWINRNRILLNNQEYTFTASLEKASQNKLIKDIYLSKDTKWKEDLLKTINVAYNRAPMFGKIYPIIQEIIRNDERNLSTFLTYSIEKLCNYLNIRTEIIKSSVPYNTKSLKGMDKILEICKQEKADGYINPIGGLELYQKEAFKKQNIRLSFLKSTEITYKQNRNNFIPFLSIIDVMMFNDKNIISGFLDEFELL
jgi:hypothetical protein